MCGTQKGLVEQINKACKESKCTKHMVIHCIIHEQALCGKHLNLLCFIEPAVSAVNFIRPRVLEFCAFLLEILSFSCSMAQQWKGFIPIF